MTLSANDSTWCAFQERLPLRGNYMTTRDVANLLDTTEDAVLKLAERGILKTIRRGHGLPVIYDTASVGQEMTRRREEREPRPPFGVRPTGQVARFCNRVEVDEITGCWMWQGALLQGYGGFSIDGRRRPAHVASHLLFVGEVPEGFHVDHLCCVKACVNPDHLEAVPPGENSKRHHRRMKSGQPNQFFVRKERESQPCNYETDTVN